MEVNGSYKSQTSLLFACLVSLAHFSDGFSTNLIQVDSPFSPTYNPAKSAGFNRLRRAFDRSLNRAGRYKSLTSSLAARSGPIQSWIVPSEGEYLMNISIGTPPVPLLGIADTGSDLTWTQCKPCEQCFKQTPRMYDPSASSTYRSLTCASQPCSQLPESACLTSPVADDDACGYSYSYGDRSYTRGTLASETLTLGLATLPGIAFGCGHENGGTFDESGSGIIGLGGGKLSLVSQLGGPAKFSYCLVPLSDESRVRSKITFGAAASVSGAGVVTTPLAAKQPDTFYYLTLRGVSVGDKRLAYDATSSLRKLRAESNEGNIVIDSGTTLTFLPVGFHDALAAAVEEAVGGAAERVSDPRGVMSVCFRAGDSFHAPTVTAHFEGGDVVLQPVNTFARVEDDVVCMTMIASDDVAIFGNLAQMNFLVGYDLEGGTVSFKPADCAAMDDEL